MPVPLRSSGHFTDICLAGDADPAHHSVMLFSGLLSITFRDLSTKEIIDLAVRAGVNGIEWGGDVHVPPDDQDHASRVGRACADHGLSVPTYGSYYVAGTPGGEGPDFVDVLRTTRALGASTVRVWTGNVASRDATTEHRKRVTDDLRRICAMAANECITVAMEFHCGSLNDEPASSLRLFDEVGADNLATFWQTTNEANDDYCLDTIRQLSGHIRHVHVFNWHSGFTDQTLLSDGAERWSRFIPALAALPGDRFASIEYVLDGKPDNFLRDAATLKAWISKVDEASP